VLIEIQTRDRLAVHQDVSASVDALLRAYPLPPEIRSRDDNGEIRVERAPSPATAGRAGQGGYRRQSANGGGEAERASSRGGLGFTGEDAAAGPGRNYYTENPATRERTGVRTIRIYAYGVARNRLQQAAKRLGVPVAVVDEPDEADVLVTLRSYYRKHQRTIVDAEHRGMPIYVLRANTVNQMQQFLGDLFNLSTDFPPEFSGQGSALSLGGQGEDPVLQETQAAIRAVLNGERWIELPPAVSHVRRLQHQMAREANLVSHSYGKEPYRRVRIFRE
jgi:hypothetical protein